MVLRALERDESCAYLAPDTVTGCRAPRSCRSCLETATCLVDYAGSCVSQQSQAADTTHSYERAVADGFALPNATATTTTMQSWLFPAGSVSYCNASQDAVCDDCVATNFYRAKTSYPDSRFCLGASGHCVCIDVCERPWAVKPDCSSNSGPTPVPAPTRVVLVGGPMTYSGTARGIFYAFLGATMFVVVALAFMVRARLGGAASSSEIRGVARQRRDQARREQRLAQLGVNPLSLSGWEAFRRELIDKETAQLAATVVFEKPGEGLGGVDTTSDQDDRDGDQCHQDEHGDVYVRVHGDDVRASEAASPSPREAFDMSASSASTRSDLLAPLTVVPLPLPTTQSSRNG